LDSGTKINYVKEEEFKFGKMDPSIKDIGKMIWQMEKED